MDFTYPPTRVYVFGSKNKHSWIPLDEIDYNGNFTKHSDSKGQLPKMIIISSNISII